MSETLTPTEVPAAKKPVKKRTKPHRASPAPKPEKPDEFAGMTVTACPAACSTERCVISTVNVCKHPLKAGDAGCGPITMANRERAKKYLKHQRIDAN